MPVTRFEVTLRRPLAGGRSFGDAGDYEELAGTLHFTVDPGHAANRAITDVALAPRDASGRVTFASDVSILLPVDRSRIGGKLILDVVNRGNRVTVPDFNHATRPVLGPNSDPHPPIDAGDGWLMRRGWVVASCGWQCDLPMEVRGLVGMEAPDALGPDGRSLTGRDRKSTRLNSSHLVISYAVFCLKKKKKTHHRPYLRKNKKHKQTQT